LEITRELILQAIRDAKQGQQQAFRYLLDVFWNDVFLFQLKRLGNEHDAEDITIETFSKAFDRIESFDEDYSFSTWLIAISKNLQIDKSRRRKVSVQAQAITGYEDQVKGVADRSPTPEDKLITQQQLDELLRFIKQLKPHYQEVINLRYFHEMSYNEIAQHLNESLSNVKVRLLRARKLLAEIIQQNPGT
jgi:RNA polymerase sigma-70 factor (ECF subfamily)